MYAGRDYQKNDFLQDVGDLVIPIVDMDEHNSQYSREDWKFLWDEYTWDAETLRMDNEGMFGVNSASPGFGAAANSFLAIFNVEEGRPSLDMAGLHRSEDPGAGAFSPYYDRKTTAKRSIQAGEEFFVSYGENWFLTRSHFGPVPLFRELDQATKLAKVYHKIKNKGKFPKVVLDDLWDTFIRNSPFTDSRVLGAFNHENKDEKDQLETTTLKKIRQQQSTRSLEWLEEHGTCGDHIVARKSTLPQAGRGGFASRFLPAGTAVAHLPLIHVSDRGRLTMYNLSKKENKVNGPSRKKGVLGYQLLLNYCFGFDPEQSSLLLCPYGPMTNYINHNATLANVELRWADPSRGNHMPELLTRNISALEADATAKLAFEFVAKRDIQPGEELFLDYGEAWEDAWQHHITSWKPAEGAKAYVPAWKVNEYADPLWTVFDEMEEPKYPKNVEARCDRAFLSDDDEIWISHMKNGTIESYLAQESEPLVKCEVMRYELKNGAYLYTVTILEDDPDDDGKIINHLVEGIPRAGIKFVDRPYTSDIFLPNAFRHDIRIPDTMFPEAWRI